MKKILLFFLLVSMGISAQNYHSLTPNEIESCRTPQAVAWNFVMSIVNQDYNKMESLCEQYFLAELQDWLRQAGVSSYSQLFVEDRIHDIVGIRPILREGWRLVCADEYYHDLSSYSDIPASYQNLSTCSVRFNCVKDGLLYPGQSEWKHDATVRVILVYSNDKWRVFGFK